MCADCLTKRENTSDSPLVILNIPPTDIYLAIVAEAQEVIFSRK
jgi:hypothetical protein